MKNCIRPPYEKLKSLKSGFIENSNFENNRDPWPALLPPKWVWKRRFISGFQQGMCSSWEMSVFQLLVNQNSLWPRPRLETLLLGTATLAWWNAPVVHLAHPVPTWTVRRPSRPFWDWAVRAIHAKNVWCCGEGYFGQKKIAEKVRKSRQNVNRDKSA